MAKSELILLDTSILIDFYRKKHKSKSKFYSLTETYNLFAVSVITEYEILVGTNETTQIFWNNFFEQVMVLPFDRQTSKWAANIVSQLKQENKLIEVPDIFISATAIANNLKIATLNKKHFERIDGLHIIPM